MTIENEEKWIASMNSSDRSTLMLAIETSEGEYIGNMGLHNINWRDRTATTGTLIGEKNYWGKGLGTEAKILLLRHAFHTMNLRKICSQVIEFNGRSKRYSEKCGYKSEGVLRMHTFRRGRYWDLENLAVFAEDFATVWERYERGEF
jgi:RimJ/RimL family protein N-acetyltransferase